VVPEAGRLAFVPEAPGLPGGGLAAADALCQAEANAESLLGTFKALLGTEQATAASRFNLNGAPWVRVDGVPWVSSAAALAGTRDDASDFMTGLNVTAAGELVISTDFVTLAWTGGLPGQVGLACTAWTSTVLEQRGSLGQPESAGTAGVGCCTASCSSARRLYCLEE
jgi:hypothetical protein